jgi:hypothetical protein
MGSHDPRENAIGGDDMTIATLILGILLQIGRPPADAATRGVHHLSARRASDHGAGYDDVAAKI